LLEAWELASGSSASVIVWLHATQPLASPAAEELRQLWERRPDGPQLLAMQFGPGPNRVVRVLDGIPGYRSIPRVDTPQADLKYLFAGWNGQQPVWQITRTQLAGDAAIGNELPAASQTSLHLARLWAADQARHLSLSRDPADREAALNLAVRYQLVTPVSGAVVLETAAQYQEAGLEPVEGGSVPTIPEPETWALIVIAAILLGSYMAKLRHDQQRRRRRCEAVCRIS
jgi:hypothetical protein